MRGIVELLSSEARNSAFHATRLDVEHIASVVESLVASAERRFGVDRHAIAPETVFMSHETYTPARGGSASAEVMALRRVFGPAASDIVVANTKGFTGHPMGVGVEDVIAVKILEHGIVPPVPNFKEVDPDLGPLNLSRGGRYPVRYAIHLAAGFGSQIALTLTRRIPGSLDRVESRPIYERWLAHASGYERAETEVVKRVFRVVAQGAPARVPMPSAWTWGTGPTRRAAMPAPVAVHETRPAPMAVSAPPHVAAPAPRAEVGPLPVAAAPSAAAAPPPQNTARPAPVAPVPTAPVAPASAPAAAVTVAAAPAELTSVSSLPPAPGVAEVTSRVLEIVASKTGYPPDMLELELDLEADLGVDTVKQAETFAAVREAYGIPRQEDLKLRDFPTLRHVVGFVLTHAAAAPVAPVASGAPAAAAASATAISPPAAFAPGPHPAATLVAPSADSSPQTGSSSADAVRDCVLAIVADKTGYPSDMLDLDLDLEADLGVDTVKQAETFAAVRQAYDIPRQESLKLRDFPTLQHVVQFVFDHRPDLRAAAPIPAEPIDAAPTTPPVPAEGAPTEPPPLPSAVEPADGFPRRVPTPSLRPALDVCNPTGVTLAARSRVVVGCEAGGIASALMQRLEARGVVALSLPAGIASEDLARRVGVFLDDGPVQGVFWLPALDVEPPLAEMDLDGFREANRRRLKNLYAVMRAFGDSLGRPGTFLVCATRMGGLHGQGTEGASAPLGGAVAGFAKAYKRERPETLVKVVDFAPELRAVTIVDALIDETGTDPGAVEIGYHDGMRWALALEERPAADGRPGMILGKETVFLVTGAAGGITSAIVADLAAASGGTFHLLDLAPEPSRDDPKIALLRQGRETLKQALIEEARSQGKRPKPVTIDREILAVERAEAALRAIEAVEAAGGRAVYRSADLRDATAVRAVVDEVRDAHGRIDVLVHAGGIEISHALADKEPAEFDRVFDIKADGFFNLLKAAEGMPLGATVVFSSVAGRFGNAGQTDYSAANALLCSLSSHLPLERPQTRALAIDWTAWAGIGMATRGSIPAVMAAAGIEMLPPEVGIPVVRRELVAGGASGEVVVAGALGVMTSEWDETGGLDVEKLQARLAQREHPFVMMGVPRTAALYGGFLVETTLDPAQQPFLFDHRIEGTPVLPGVMGTEAFAEIANVLCPGYRVEAIEDEEFLLPFKFHRMHPATLRLSATGAPGPHGEIVVSAALRSVVRPKPELPAQEKLHFRARVRMTRRPVTDPAVPFDRPALERLTIGPESVYRVYFHGPAYRVLDRVTVEDSRAIGLMATPLPPDASPADAEELTAPRLLELCFQTAGVWLLAKKQTMALPAGLDRVTVFRRPEDAGGGSLFAVVKPSGAGETFDAQVVDDQGRVYLELSRYRTVSLPERATLVA
jgi:NAD(P)-dependent dehydrogenase (short-subunit alcohol dehydrogenase family)/acyl carrier protein